MLIEVAGKQVRVTGRLLRVARLEGDSYEFLEDPQPMLEGLRRAGVRIDLFSFMQRLPETEPKYSHYMEWDNFAAVPVTTFEHWWNKQIGYKARNKAKQAEKKGVEIREVPFGEELVRGIAAIYNECPVRQGRRFPHYGKSYEEIYRAEATYLDRSVFVGAYFEGQLIGFVKLVADETFTQAGLMNILSMIQHRDKAPTNALVAHAVRVCAERGIRYLVYSQYTYGNKEQSSIMDFKERNAFEQINVPRYWIPYTLRGRLALRLGLHRRLVERVPEPILARLREYRSAWYARKFAAASEVA